MNKPSFSTITVALLSMLLFLIFVSGSTNTVVFDKGFYNQQYEDNGVYGEISSNDTIAREMAANVTNNIIDYFRGKTELKYFDEREKSHMLDVKNVLSAINYIYYSATFLIIVLFFYLYVKLKHDRIRFVDTITKSMVYSSIACISFFVFLFLLATFYFDQLFTIFHMIFFPQGNWQFYGGLMITLFTKDFFFDAFLRIFVYAVFQSAIFLGIGWWLNRQLKNYRQRI